MITDERREELERAWDECDNWDDEDYREWWEELTDEEKALIESWDKQYAAAFNHLAKAKTEGRLYYNADQGRYGLMSQGKWVVDGLHCGECLEVWIDGEWIQTRVEMAEDWYLVGLPGVVMYDLRARI